MDSGCRPESVWIATAPGDAYPSLEERVEADVAIAGAGIVGITAAHLLRQAGLTVALLERGRVAGGVSGKTTAKVTSQHGLSLDGLVRKFGEERIRLHAQANESAKDLVLRLAKDLEADGTAAPNYVYTTEKGRVGELRQEADTAARLGLPATLTTETELPFPVAAAVRFERQAHMHPRKYLLGLVDRMAGPDCQVYEQSPVTAIEEDRDGGSCTVKTPAGEVAARHVLVATHVPILDRIAYTPRMQPKREYGIALGAGGCEMEGMYVSADDPRRSVRPWVGEAGPMLVFVGQTHPVGESQARPHYQALAEFAKDFTDDAVRYCWSTQDAYPFDGLPLVGRHAPRARRVFAATGFRAWGMTQGTVAAQLLVDLVL
ncbi:MAG TPA: FAD-binding oxidoreductase, partial [Candidatus Thermoplasmatota archaeon]|nr:FAD-binding oxidoreductase [Candidatus Thermoplasmatota archaeon]